MTKTVLALSISLVACGGSGGGGNGSGSGSGSGNPDAAVVTQPLTCSQFAYCSTYEVRQYNGTVETPAGGTIADGIYRLAWLLNPSSAGQSEGFGDYGEAMRIEHGSYVHSSVVFGRGTLKTAGTKLTFTVTNSCSDGAEGSVRNPPDTYDWDYTAMGDRLILFSQVSGSSTFTRMRVYLRVQDVCQTVDSTPATPGDSYSCHVSNCACMATTNGTIGSCT